MNNKFSDKCTDEEVKRHIEKYVNEELDDMCGQTYWKLEDNGIEEITQQEYFELLKTKCRIFAYP